jgi:hypothetical protein
MINHANNTYQHQFVTVGFSTFFQAQGASKTVFYFNMLLVGLQVATCFAAGLVFRSAIVIAISLTFSTAVTAIIGVLWAHRSIHVVARPSRARPGSAVNTPAGIAVQ